VTLEEQYAEAQAAQNALDRFLGPAMQVVEAEYAERLLEVAGSTLAKGEAEWAMLKLSMALKIARAVRGQIEAIARGGSAVEQQMERAKQIEAIRPYKRRILGL